MSFIVIAESSQMAWRELSAPGQFPFRLTYISGANNQPVVCLPSIALDELEQRNISYRSIPESAIEQELSTRGLSYFRHMRAEDPTWPETPPALPAMGQMQIEFNMIEYFEQSMRDLLESYGASEVQVNSASQHLIRIEDLASEGSDDLSASSTSHVSALIPSKNFEPLCEALASAGIAGYSRETQIRHSADPDR